jgi:uncharacterized membrane protein
MAEHLTRHVETETNGVARAAAPIYLLLFPIPVVLFLAAFVVDIAYAKSANIMWLNFAEWLLAAGLFFGTLAAIALIVEFFASRAIRANGIGWTHLVLFFLALVVELFNMFFHTRDGYTAVVPAGMTLSTVGAVLLLCAVAALLRVPVAWVAHHRDVVTYREVLP